MIQPPSLSANSQSIFPMLARQPGGVIGLRFFVSLDHEDHVALERNFIARQAHDGFSEYRDAALEIDGAAAVYIAVFDDAGEGINGPLFALDTDHVGMRSDQHRARAAVAFES